MNLKYLIETWRKGNDLSHDGINAIVEGLDECAKLLEAAAVQGFTSTTFLYRNGFITDEEIEVTE